VKISLELETPSNILVSDGELAMEYSMNFANVDRELADGHYKASVVYTFAISNDVTNTHGHVVLTDGGVEIIEQRGKDPQTAARIALERLLKQGRNPFETRIFLRVPFRTR
jgi:hypothetical protein